MRGRLIALTAALGAVCGCASDQDLYVELPEMVGQTVLAAVTVQSRVTYYASTTTGRLRFDLSEGERAEIALAFFDEPLDRLGLVEGPVTTTVDTFARPLPPMATSFVATFADGAVGPWTPVTTFRAPLEAFRLPPRRDLAPNCAWEARPRLELAPDQFVRIVVTLDDGRLVVVLADRLAVVGRDNTQAAFVLPATPRVTVIGAERNNTLLLADNNGGLWRGTLETDGSVTVVMLVDGAGAARIHRATRVGDTHLLARVDSSLVLFDGATTISLGKVAGRAIAAVDPNGRVYIAVDRTIYAVVDGVLTELMTVDRLVAGLFIDEDGALLAGLRAGGGYNGGISRLDPDVGTAVELHGTGREGDLWFMLQTARGITYFAGYEAGGEIGAAYHFVPGYGSCGGALARIEERPTALARFGDGFAIVLARTAPVEMIPFVAP